jgi:hypothetical protein
MAQTAATSKKWIPALLTLFILVGAGTFVAGAAGSHPERAWLTFLINFLLWSAVAQGAFLFSTMMHTVRARWSGPLDGLAESFAGFFPVSLALFALLFVGGVHVFPWAAPGHDLHGKEVWLNLPFLFVRDGMGLLLLYGLGGGYLYCSLRLRENKEKNRGGNKHVRQKDVFSILYMVAFALVLSLIGYDLVMSMDPHWVSTLFGAYSFVKAIYIGFGALIVYASLLHLSPNGGFRLPEAHFHDIGKLFFGFCLVWADFFYVQFLVIWYGNIPEETHYVIQRTMMPPWNTIAWTIFILCFVAPFFILLSKKVKTLPKIMAPLCGIIIAGIWLEHLLLLGPPLTHGADRLPLGVSDLVITLGFLALMVASIRWTIRRFPNLVAGQAKEGAEWK